MTHDSPGGPTRALRVGFVPGVTPDKWARIWAERMPRVPLELFLVEEPEQVPVLYDGRADMCFVRLPVDQDRLHVIPLYSEVPVVVAPKEHFIEAADEVRVADLADEHLLQDPAQVPEWAEVASEIREGSRVDVPPITMKQAIETVAAGVGIVIVPMSVARLHHRKDVVHRPVTDVAESRIGLAWRRDLDDDRFETFIGVVRGRTANSSRGSDPPPSARKPVGRRNSPRRRGR
ncbi:MAG TPA: LysR family substrate-binding domain-containing protein [Nocardioidaceae bacterium]|nr:LysR family substrate-binding domain-containing protein [Nocardioidaceae bacterium]